MPCHPTLKPQSRQQLSPKSSRVPQTFGVPHPCGFQVRVLTLF